MLSDERRQVVTEELATYIKENLDVEVGVIATSELLDFFLQNASEDIYAKGIKDTRDALQKKLEDLDVDLDMLLQK